jgi:hypothetical protein
MILLIIILIFALVFVGVLIHSVSIIFDLLEFGTLLMFVIVAGIILYFYKNWGMLSL